MRIYNDITQLNCQNASAVALGYFDGMHIGHRAVISAAAKCASAENLQTALLTFALPDNDSIKGRDILQQEEKQLRASSLQVEHYFCPSFEALRELSCEEFVEQIIVKRLCAKAVFCGSNYTFGAKKSGDIDTLKKLCLPHKISVSIAPMVAYGGTGVSSTRIRAAMQNGEIRAANQMLGATYAVSLPVMHGKGLGHTIGVPTINQYYPQNMQKPKSGVYASRVIVDGKAYAGATGFGSRPTVGGVGVSCETYIKGFNGDLYGKIIRVEFLDFLQETQKFESLDALRDCIITAANKSEKINSEA